MRQIVGYPFGGIILIRNETFQRRFFFSFFSWKKNFSFLNFFNFSTVWCFEFFKNGLVLNILIDLYIVNCPKIKKSENKKNFQKKTEIFFSYFLKFFIPDCNFWPKIMTNNFSHVLIYWLYTKKVSNMHVLCTPKHNFQKKWE